MANAADLPDRVREALRGRGFRRLPFPDEETWPAAPEPGQLRVALPMDLPSPDLPPRLVLVFEVELGEDPWVNASLVAEGPEPFTASDVRLEASETGLPFAVVIETDVVGPLFVAQLGPVLGSVEPDVLADLRRELAGDRSPRFAGRRGLPVFAHEDSRWAWKDRELATMHMLSFPCMRRELQPVTRVPETLVLVEAAATAAVMETDEPAERLHRLLRLLSAVGAPSPAAVELVPADVSQARSLVETVAELGSDALRAAEPALAGALRGRTGPAPRARWRPGWPSTGREALERRIVARALEGVRSCRVVTRRGRLARRGSPDVHALEIEGIGIVQVKAEEIEEEAA